MLTNKQKLLSFCYLQIDKQRQQLRDLKYGKKVKVIQPQEPIEESVSTSSVK